MRFRTLGALGALALLAMLVLYRLGVGGDVRRRSDAGRTSFR